MPVSAQECAASARIDADPVSTPATDLAAAIRMLAPNATRIVVRLSDVSGSPLADTAASSSADRRRVVRRAAALARSPSCSRGMAIVLTHGPGGPAAGWGRARLRPPGTPRSCTTDRAMSARSGSPGSVTQRWNEVRNRVIVSPAASQAAGAVMPRCSNAAARPADHPSSLASSRSRSSAWAAMIAERCRANGRIGCIRSAIAFRLAAITSSVVASGGAAVTAATRTSCDSCPPSNSTSRLSGK